MQFVRPSLSFSRTTAAATCLGALALLLVLLAPSSPKLDAAAAAALAVPALTIAAPAPAQPPAAQPAPAQPAPAQRSSRPLVAARAEAPALIALPPPRPARAEPAPRPRPRLLLAAVSTRSYDIGRPLPRPEANAAALGPSQPARLAPLLVEAAALVEAPPNSLRDASPLACLAVSIYHEARDQPLLGQQAVAAVILRRVEVSRWGDTICAVVRPVQFSYLSADYSFPPIRERVAWRRALTVAIRALLDGPTPLVSGADHYHATYVSPAWGEKMREVVRIGSHVFYRDPLSAARRAAAGAQDPADPLRTAARPAASVR